MKRVIEIEGKEIKQTFKQIAAPIEEKIMSRIQLFSGRVIRFTVWKSQRRNS